MYRKLYVDECVDIVCNAVKVQSPLTMEVAEKCLADKKRNM